MRLPCTCVHMIRFVSVDEASWRVCKEFFIFTCTEKKIESAFLRGPGEGERQHGDQRDGLLQGAISRFHTLTFFLIPFKIVYSQYDRKSFRSIFAHYY